MNTRCLRCGAEYPEGRLGACPRCILEADLESLVLGGAFELLEPIGQGGMGAVYKARDLRFGRTVAVKILAPELAAETEFQKRFEREARSLALLRHPHIVAFHEFACEPEQSYIVMEYVDGHPLSEELPLTSRRALEVADQVLDALAYAHKHGLVHRDIKPSNILLDREGQVKVSDFGIARFASSSHRSATETPWDRVIGTLPYMAPEARTGALPDPRQDVYSLGVVLYEVVTGAVPVGYFELPSPPFDRIVRKALIAQPERRYANAGEMRHDLMNGENGGEVQELGYGGSFLLLAVALIEATLSATALDRLSMGPGPWSVERLVGSCVLLALVAFWVRGYWRRRDLPPRPPDGAMTASDWVLRLGVLAVLLYPLQPLLRELGRASWSMPVAALQRGVDLAGLFCVWVAVFRAWHDRCPISHLSYLWLGLALLLLPHVLDAIRTAVAALLA